MRGYAPELLFSLPWRGKRLRRYSRNSTSREAPTSFACKNPSNGKSPPPSFWRDYSRASVLHSAR